MSRSARPTASDLLLDGWLPPLSAASALGVTRRELERRADNGEIRRKPIGPGAWLYEVPR